MSKIDRSSEDRRQYNRRIVDYVIRGVVLAMAMQSPCIVTSVLKASKLLPDPDPFTDREGDTCRRRNDRRVGDESDPLSGMAVLKQRIIHRLTHQYD